MRKRFGVNGCKTVNEQNQQYNIDELLRIYGICYQLDELDKLDAKIEKLDSANLNEAKEIIIERRLARQRELLEGLVENTLFCRNYSIFLLDDTMFKAATVDKNISLVALIETAWHVANRNTAINNIKGKRCNMLIVCITTFAMVTVVFLEFSYINSAIKGAYLWKCQ